jgi:NDP-sugar pyrophosphorylase family protein
MMKFSVTFDQHKKEVMKPLDLLTESVETPLKSWIETFSTLELLFKAMPRLFTKLDRQYIRGSIHRDVSVEGPVHVGAGSVIHGSVRILGPVILGDYVEIGSASELRGPVYIGTGTNISHGSTVMNSLVLNKTAIGAGSYVSNAIIGSNCVIGPRAMLGVNQMSPRGKTAAPDSDCEFTALGACAQVGAGAIVEHGALISPSAVIDNGLLVQVGGSAQK